MIITGERRAQTAFPNALAASFGLLQDLSDSAIGELNLGLTWEHGIDMFTEIFPAFNKRFPRFTIHISERSVAQQHQLILSGHLDVGFVMLQDAEKIDAAYIDLCQEELLLGIPKTHPLAVFAPAPGSPLPYIDLAALRRSLFSIYYAGCHYASVSRSGISTQYSF